MLSVSGRVLLVGSLIAASMTLSHNVVASADPAPSISPAGSYVPLIAQRVFDSRHQADGGFNGLPLPARHTAGIELTGTPALPPEADGGTALLNVTVTDTASAGYVTLWSGAARPAVSSVNFAGRRSTSSLVAVAYGVGNTGVNFYNGSSSSINVIVDVVGYYVGGTPSASGRFGPVDPFRAFDSRTHHAALRPNGSASVPVTGVNGVPATGVGAVLATVTAVSPSSSGYLSTYADGARLPATSVLDFAPHVTTSNLAVVPVGADGRMVVRNGSRGSTDVTVDVVGYFQSGSPTAPGATGVVEPARLLDTRSGLGASRGAVAGRHSVRLRVTGRGGVPTSGVATVTLDITATGATRGGYMAVRPDGGASPGTSSLNFVAGQSVSNLITVPVATDGSVDLDVTTPGTVQLVADVASWSRPATVISGRVTDRHGHPIDTFVTAGNADSTNVWTAETDHDGRFVIGGTDGQTVSLCYDGSEVLESQFAGSVARQCWHGVSPADTPTPIDVPSGTTLVANATLPPAGAISGTVRDASGHPLTASESVHAGNWRFGVTGPPGHYFIDALPAGSYTVCFDAGPQLDAPNGYIHQCWANADTEASATPLTVSEGHVTTGIDVVLKPSPAN